MALAVIAIAAGHVRTKTLSGDIQDSPDRKIRELRRLHRGAAVCVNPPVNRTGGEPEIENAVDELAKGLRAGGYSSGLLGTLASCDAVVYTEITSRSRSVVELDFRLLLSDEQVPRLCSSARVRSGKGERWRDAVRRAFAGEAAQIVRAQEQGMPAYAGAWQ